MDKIGPKFIIQQYESGVNSYRDFTQTVGLWDSEKAVFQAHLHPDDRLLDLGCGTGRTTFALYQLGYRNILGLDLTPGMIRTAKALNTHYQTDIHFQIGDATQLDFPDEHFDSILFSFNGLMSIPQQSQRQKVVDGVHRILKPGGKFIFTTHDRNQDEDYFQFWAEQADLWEQGKQDDRLFEFGDIISSSKNETAPIFIHIPDRKEVEAMITEAGFTLVDTFYRSERFDEPPAVKEKSGECRFWVVRK